MTSSPSGARHIVTAFAISLAVITYIDRAAINVSALYITKDLGLSTIQMGQAFAAFAWAYALFEIPGGWLGDKIGPRRVLLRIVLWWSLFTAATGWAWSGDVADCDPGAVRRRGSRGLPQHDAHVHDLAAGQGARARPGEPVAGHAADGGVHAGAGRAADSVRRVAADFRDFRRARGDLGGPVLPLVPRRAGGTPGRQPGGAGAAASGAGHGHRRRAACPGA